MHSKDQSMVDAPHRGCADHDLLGLQEAERELSSFHQAVLRMCGPEEALHAAECWIEELAAAACLEKSMPWRRISVKTAAKLASRLVTEPTRKCVRSASSLDERTAARKLCHALP